jgi:hypothetical protein
VPPRKIGIEFDDLFALRACELRVAFREMGVGDRSADDERKRVKLMRAFDLRFGLGNSAQI